MGVFLVLHNHVFFFMSCSQSQKWQIQVGFEIHDWLSSSILKSLATIFSKEFCQRILFWERIIKRFDLVVTNSKNSVNTYAFSRIIQFTSHQKIKSQIRTAKFAMKIFSQKFTHFFLSCTHFAKAIIILFCVLNLAEWIEKKLRFFRAGITALVAKAFWQWISKIHYFKGRTKPKIKGIISFFM